MSVTYEDIVQHYASAWRTLRAWRAPLPAKLTFEEWKHQRVVGFARPWRREVTIRYTGRDLRSLAFDLGTVLHELAHLAAPNLVHHEQPWRELFVASCVEVCKTAGGIDAFDTDVAITDLDVQVRSEVLRWLNFTGEAKMLTTLGIVQQEGART